MYKADYWDIDDFLAEEEPVVMIPQRNLKKLGYLDPNNRQEDLAQGTKAKVPFWLSLALATRGFVKIELPSMFNESYRASLQAEPRILTLKEKSSYFFRFGGKLAHSLKDTELTPILLEVFLQRFKYLLQNIDTEKETQVRKKLTNLEDCLFRIGHKIRTEFQEWNERRFEKIRTSDICRRPVRRIKLN